MASTTSKPALLSGIVKAVPSGDTVILLNPNPPKSGPPPELRLNLASIRAPTFRTNPATPASTATTPANSTTAATQNEEPYGFAAREALRKTLIGKNVTFRIEYKVPQFNRTCGTVYVDGKSVSHDLVEQGLVRVRRPNSDREERSSEYTTLCALEDQAIATQKGVHSKGTDQSLTLQEKNYAGIDVFAKRHVVEIDDPLESWDSFKGKTLIGVVEHVVNGSTLKILFNNDNIVPSFNSDPDVKDFVISNVQITGIQAPGFKRQEGTTNIPTQDVKPQYVPLPFALNARFFTESKLLHRDVKVTIDGVDKTGAFYATLSEISDTTSTNIAEQLLRAGLAKIVSWSIELSSNPAALRAAEKAARDARIGVWASYTPAPNASISSAESFSGRVLEIITGDTIMVAPDGAEPRRISLASIRAPKLGRMGERDQPAAFEARELLRKKFIGKKVNVQIDYKRPSPPDTKLPPMYCATVTKPAIKADASPEDMAELLVAQGLAFVTKHRTDEERARNYETYVIKEKEAIEKKLGIHRSTPLPVRRINDLTSQDAKKRAKEMVDFFIRAGTCIGIVEGVTTGSRFRIYIPKENALIMLALKGSKSPNPSRRNVGLDGKMTEQKGEPFGDEALNFSRESFLQRDVQVSISAVDRVGAFLGSMSLLVEKDDVSKLLLENGLATMHDSFILEKEVGGDALKAAMEQAKQNKKGLWSTYDESKVAQVVDSAKSSSLGKSIIGTVVEIGYAGKMFVHQNPDAIRNIDDALESLNISNAGEVLFSNIKIGDMIAVRYSREQNQWYRGKVIYKDMTNKDVRVKLLDYGSEDYFECSNLRKMSPSTVLSSPPLALQFQMEGIVIPDHGEEYAIDAAEYLRGLTYNRDVRLDNGRNLGGGMYSGDVIRLQDSVNIGDEMLKSGLARILRRKTKEARIAEEKYFESEQIGKSKRVGLWRWGDAYASDEDAPEEEKARRQGY